MWKVGSEQGLPHDGSRDAAGHRELALPRIQVYHQHRPVRQHLVHEVPQEGRFTGTLAAEYDPLAVFAWENKIWVNLLVQRTSGTPAFVNDS